MEDIILTELRQIKLVLIKLIGSSDRSVENPFSEAILDKVVQDFLKLSIEWGMG